MGLFDDKFNNVMEAITLSWRDKQTGRTHKKVWGGFKGIYWDKISELYPKVGKFLGQKTLGRGQGQRIAYFENIRFLIRDFGAQGGMLIAWGPNEDGKIPGNDVKLNDADLPTNKLPNSINSMRQVMAVAFPDEYGKKAEEELEARRNELDSTAIDRKLKGIETGKKFVTEPIDDEEVEESEECDDECKDRCEDEEDEEVEESDEDMDLDVSEDDDDMDLDDTDEFDDVDESEEVTVNLSVFGTPIADIEKAAESNGVKANGFNKTNYDREVEFTVTGSKEQVKKTIGWALNVSDAELDKIIKTDFPDLV